MSPSRERGGPPFTRFVQQSPWAEILLYGIDIDEAMSFGVATNLPQLAELERQRERLAQRARLLLDDIERAQTFVRKRKTVDILDAEVVA